MNRPETDLAATLSLVDVIYEGNAPEAKHTYRIELKRVAGDQIGWLFEGRDAETFYPRYGVLKLDDKEPLKSMGYKLSASPDVWIKWGSVTNDVATTFHRKETQREWLQSVGVIRRRDLPIQ